MATTANLSSATRSSNSVESSITGKTRPSFINLLGVVVKEFLPDGELSNNEGGSLAGSCWENEILVQHLRQSIVVAGIVGDKAAEFSDQGPLVDNVAKSCRQVVARMGAELLPQGDDSLLQSPFSTSNGQRRRGSRDGWVMSTDRMIYESM
ncbi:hypothetical protein E4U52_007857 [Claviceps spartinae]|nr:hypothetical protein E4U52_007857 [Claviceps spartinae]